MNPKRGASNTRAQPAAKRGRQGATTTRSQRDMVVPPVAEPTTSSAAVQSEVSLGVSTEVINMIVQKVTEQVTKNLASSSQQQVQTQAISQAAEHISDSSTCPDVIATSVVDLSVAEAQQAISGITHLREPPQSQPTQLFCSSALAVDARIPDKIRAKIWSQEYVDFGLLLTSPVADSGYRLAVSNQGNTPAISLEPISQAKKINSIETWVKCFHIFVAVYTTKFPVEAPALMKYGEIIQDLAVRGFNWKYYDENFRFLRQSQHKSLPWNAIHSELWLRSQSTFQGRKQPQYEVSRTHPSLPRVPNGYCFRFNRGQSCQNVKCPFKHTCFKCEGEHRASVCNFRGTPKSFPRQLHGSQPKTSNTSQK